MSALTIKRKTNQSFTVDGPAEIQFLKVCGKEVKVRIVAEESVKIMRAELSTKQNQAKVTA
jgi:sRNA-binding carbon storage regulator CsrA